MRLCRLASLCLLASLRRRPGRHSWAEICTWWQVMQTQEGTGTCETTKLAISYDLGLVRQALRFLPKLRLLISYDVHGGTCATQVSPSWVSAAPKPWLRFTLSGGTELH